MLAGVADGSRYGCDCLLLLKWQVCPMIWSQRTYRIDPDRLEKVDSWDISLCIGSSVVYTRYIGTNTYLNE